MSGVNDRVQAYYKAIMEQSGKSYDPVKMQAILAGITDEESNIIIDSWEGNKDQHKRLNTYWSRLSDVQRKQEQADCMEKVLKNVGNYDIGSEQLENINGNTFIFSPDFPIDEYWDELTKIGDSETGNEYHVGLKDGRLVVY